MSRMFTACFTLLALIVQAGAAGCRSGEFLCRADELADAESAELVQEEGRQGEGLEGDEEPVVDLLQTSFDRIAEQQALLARENASGSLVESNASLVMHDGRNPFGDILGDVMGQVKNVLGSAAVDAFVNTINSTLQSASQQVDDFLGAVADYQNGLLANVTAAGMHAVDFLVAQVSSRLHVLQAKFNQIADIIKAAVPSITTVIKGLGLNGSAVKAVEDGAVKLKEVTGIIDFCLSNTTAIVLSWGPVNTSVGVLEDGVSQLKSSIQVGLDAAQSLGDSLVKMLGGLLNIVASKLGAKKNSSVKQLQKTLQGVSDTWVLALGDLLRGTSQAATTALTAVKDGLGTPSTQSATTKASKRSGGVRASLGVVSLLVLLAAGVASVG